MHKSFNVYIHRTLKKSATSFHITKPALEAIDSVIRVTAVNLVNKSLLLTLTNNKKTVSQAELETSVKLVLPPLLMEGSLAFANTAVESFNNFVEGEEKSRTRESRAGLIFSVSATEKYLRCFGQNGLHVSATAPVFLAGVLEFLISEILKLSSVHTCKKVTITVKHIFTAIHSDPEFERFINNIGLVFLDAGVTAHIEPSLLEPKNRKRINSNAGGVKKPHRWRPGTKTLMNIRKLQKTSDLIIQHAPFNRLVRDVGSETKKLRYTNDFLLSLQSFVEDRMIRVMKCANRLALHTGRETVYACDVTLAQEFMEPLLVTSKEPTDNTVIPEAALRKLALRAGIKRYGDDSTETYTRLVVDFVGNYVRDIILCAELHQVQTLTVKLMIESLGMRGLHPATIPRTRKMSKKTNSSRSTSVAVTDNNVSDVEDGELGLPDIDE